MILAIGETDLSVAVRKVSTDIGDGVAQRIAVRVPGSTPSRTLFVHAVVIWSVAQFAAFALVGHRRARAAVGAPLALAFGTAIFGDGQVGAELALTSVGALLVLVEHHALESQTIWARRRLGDGSITARRQRRSGAPYAIIAVVCATAMAGVLRVDPLAGLWRDAAGLRDLMSTVGGMVPMPRSATGDDGSFDAVAFGLVDVWQPGDGIALRATIAAGLDGPWRATTFDRFAGDGWLQSQGRSVEVGAGESLDRLGRYLRDGCDDDRDRPAGALSRCDARQPRGRADGRCAGDARHARRRGDGRTDPDVAKAVPSTP